MAADRTRLLMAADRIRLLMAADRIRLLMAADRPPVASCSTNAESGIGSRW